MLNTRLSYFSSIKIRYKIVIIEEILKFLKPKKCLEWGTGYSTFYFSNYLEKDAEWIGIEHDESWYNTIQSLMGDNGAISIYHIPPNHDSWSDTDDDGDFSDFRDYINFPETLKKKFDLILIDGRARKPCLNLTTKLLKKDGIVILHDANREQYGPFKLYRNQVLFQDTRRKAGGVYIGTNGKLHNVLDVKKHKLNWIVWRDITQLVSTVNTFRAKMIGLRRAHH